MPLNGKRLLFSFLLLWLLINWIQAGLSELDPDESYYWMYSKVLDWGYFDHPPVIAVLVHYGYALFPNELGLRFWVVFLQPISIYVMWLVLGKPQDRDALLTFLLLFAAIPILQVYGFIATPDGPLLFFTALFLYAYQQFCEKATLPRSLFLGFCMAALLYSKYHGLVLILLTTASNLQLFRKKEFYLAGIVGVLLFVPHLYWQYINDFPSFRYHLKGRDDLYELTHTTDYLIAQLFIFSPFLFPLFIRALLRSDIKNALDRACYFIIIGFWIFFLYTTFKGKVEAQWTAILSFPLAIMALQYSRNQEVFRRWLLRMSLLSIGIFFILRLLIIIPVPLIKSNFHNSAWIPIVQEASQGYPIVFENSYRDASKYSFYTGELSYTITDYKYRKNQYDIWDWEKALHNQKVFLAGGGDWKCKGCELLKPPRKTYLTKFIDSLQVSQKVRFLLPEGEWSWKGDTAQKMAVQIANPYDHDVKLDVGNMPISAQAIFSQDGVVMEKLDVDLDLRRPVFPKRDTFSVEASFYVPDTLIGRFDFSLGLRTGDLPASFNSKFRKVEIEK